MLNIPEERKANLNSEQLEIVKGWEEKAEARQVLNQKLQDAYTAKDNDLIKSVIEELEDAEDEYCAHERSMMSDCYECHKIENILAGKEEEEEEDDE